MNNKQRKTLNKILAKSTPSDLMWREVAALIRASGGEYDDSRNGSRINIRIGTEYTSIHDHKGSKPLKKEAVKDLKKLFEKLKL